jgi:hypothetical protein
MIQLFGRKGILFVENAGLTYVEID